MRYPVSIFMCLLLVVIGTIEIASSHGRVQEKNEEQVKNVKSRPDLASELDKVARLKLASRKSTFHVGEMIDLDIALLNSSGMTVFFQKLSDPRIKAQSSNGGSHTIQPYGVIERTITPSSFTLIAPNEFDVGSFHLLVGCDKRAFEQVNSVDKDSLAIFNQNLFLNWGDACLNLSQPGTYTLTAEISNNYVFVSTSEEKVKTAAGKIKSNPLKITIID